MLQAASTNGKATALHVAAHRDTSDFIALLVEKASEDHKTFHEFLNHQNNDGKTALWESAETSQGSNVQLLLKHGADYLIAANDGVTTLHVASSNSHTAVVSLFVEEAKTHLDRQQLRDFLNRRSKWGKTALIDAAERNRPEIISLLLEHGADYSIGDKKHFTALHYCAARNHAAPVRCLLKKASPDKIDNGEKFKRFLNQQGGVGKTALIDAAETNRPEIISLLREYGADYSISDYNNFTALHYCAIRNHAVFVRCLLEKASLDNTDNGEKFKRFLNQRGKNNRASALCDVAWRGLTDVVNVLLSYGAAYDHFNSDERSLLHHAIDREFTSIAIAIIDRAKRDEDKERSKRVLNEKDAYEVSVWDAAKEEKIEPVLEALRGCGIEIEGM